MTKQNTHFVRQVNTVPLRQKKDYRNLINLSSNEFLYPELNQFVDSWIKNLTSDMIGKYPYYPTAEDAVARYFNTKQERVTLFPGADEAIRVLMFVLGSHKKLVLSWPNYDSYETYADMVGLRVSLVNLTRHQNLDDHVVSLKNELLSHSPSIFVITNPHPVTGEVYSDNALKELEQLCDSLEHLMVVDETYAGFSGDSLTVDNEARNYLSIRSFSKCFGLAGLRLCALTGAPETIEQLRRWRGVNAISGPSLALLEHLLANTGFVKSAIQRLTDTRRWFCASLFKKGYRYWESSANFVLIDLQGSEKGQTSLKKLRDRNIVVKTFSDEHPFSECIRVALGERKIMEVVLSCL